jgi:hypothetical protein
MAASRSDPRVKKLIDAWLTFAKSEGISTPTSSGRPAEDKDLMQFIHQHLAASGMTPTPDLVDKIEKILSKVPTSTTSTGNPAPAKSPEQLNRMKALIKTKLTPAQQQQLRRDLAHG